MGLIPTIFVRKLTRNDCRIIALITNLLWRCGFGMPQRTRARLLNHRVGYKQKVPRIFEGLFVHKLISVSMTAAVWERGVSAGSSACSGVSRYGSVSVMWMRLKSAAAMMESPVVLYMSFPYGDDVRGGRQPDEAISQYSATSLFRGDCFGQRTPSQRHGAYKLLSVSRTTAEPGRSVAVTVMRTSVPAGTVLVAA